MHVAWTKAVLLSVAPFFKTRGSVRYLQITDNTRPGCGDRGVILDINPLLGSHDDAKADNHTCDGSGLQRAAMCGLVHRGRV